MTNDSSSYEPPKVEELPSEDGPSTTAAGATQPYGAITLVEPDD